MKYTLRIFRGTPNEQYWEEFELTDSPGDNIISALMEIQKNPINKEGLKTTPVVWEQGCLEEVCGSCSMLVNGHPCQACTQLIGPLTKRRSVITLAPFTKFPLIRDLCVDRTPMFEALKKVHAWTSADGSWDREEFAPKYSPELQEALYVLSTCMVCGCCSEACPQVSERSEFMGPAAISQARRFDSTPAAAFEKSQRLRAILGADGIAGCGNAQNCVRVCPKRIPLTESIAVIGREATKQALKDTFGVADS